MAPTVGECTVVSCPANEGVSVKEYVRYHLGEFPFTTARKITHLRCTWCRGILSADKTVELMDDMCKNRLFIQEQDKMYKYTGDESLKVIPFMDTVSHLNIVQPSAKQWHKGWINYLRFVQLDDKVIIKPTSTPYEVYCVEEERLSVAAKQFVKPDDYFKLTSIQ